MDVTTQINSAIGEHGSSFVLLRNVIGKKLGLNIADTECLSLLFTKGISSPTELSSHTGLTTGSTTAMLDRLEKAKLITRKPNPDDRRGVLIEVNQKLANIVGPLFTNSQKAQDKLINSYSPKELQTIIDFVTKFTNNLRDYTKKVDREVGCISLEM